MLQARTARNERDFAFQQLKRSQEHDEFLEFLLADAPLPANHFRY